MRKRETFDGLIRKRLGTSISPTKSRRKRKSKQDENDPFIPYEDNDEVARDLPEQEDFVNNKGHLLDQQPAYDNSYSKVTRWLLPRLRGELWDWMAIQ